MEKTSAPAQAAQAESTNESTLAASDPTSPTEATSLGAVPESARIGALDVVRGVAVLGILVMNIQSFSMIEAAYENPTAFGDFTGINYAVWLVSHLLADQKFMTIFAMLFGAGIVLMTGRREKAGLGSAALHYRRMSALAGFGLVHAYGLWYGDILFSYAVCGMLVYPLRRLRPRFQIVLGGLGLILPSLLLFLLGLLLNWVATAPQVSSETHAALRQFLQENWRPSTQQIEAETAAYCGGWWAQNQERWASSFAFQTLILPLIVLWRAGGLMLLGMALFKLGFFSAACSPRCYALVLAAALLVGLPSILYGVWCNTAAHWDLLYDLPFGGQFNYWGSILVSLGWVALTMLAYQRRSLRCRLRPLACVGQMALTNYLLQTLICTTLFYGHGFGLFGRVERIGQIGIVFGVWLVELLVSPLWLHRFHFGPAEWLWRCLTYGKLPPFHRLTAPAG